MSPHDRSALSEIRRFAGICRALLFPPLDPEDLAVGIWLESSQAGFPSPSWEFISHRCYDEIRRFYRDRRAGECSCILKDRLSLNGEADLLDSLFELADLSPPERDLLYRKFYLGEYLSQREMGTLRGALRKLRASGKDLLL